MNPREEELVARHLLAHQELIDVYLTEHRWAEVAAVVRYARRDVPTSLAATDPALYKTLRAQISRFFVNGGAVFSLPRLEQLAGN